MIHIEALPGVLQLEHAKSPPTPELWSGRPVRPLLAKGMVIWGAPKGASVNIMICGTPIGSLSNIGIPALQFAPEYFRACESLIAWPVIDTAIGVQVNVFNVERRPIGWGLKIVVYGNAVHR